MTQEQIQKLVVSSATPINDEDGNSSYFVITNAAMQDLIKSLHKGIHEYSCYAYNTGLIDGKDCGRLDNRW
jgi:hypothetical protein